MAILRPDNPDCKGKPWANNSAKPAVCVRTYPSSWWWVLLVFTSLLPLSPAVLLAPDPTTLMLRISEYATSKMRGFFRALSGLFRSTSHASAPKRRRNGSPNHVVDGALQPVRFSTVLQQQAQSSPTPQSPVPVLEAATTTTTTSRQWQPRPSSIYEPPQFLFFCGNENTARGSSFSLRLSRRGSAQAPAPAPPAAAPTGFTEVPQKSAASRMPVFFSGPQQKHTQSSPPEAAEWTRPMNAPHGLIL